MTREQQGNRTISANSLALRWALASSFPSLRREARKIIAAAFDASAGKIGEAAKRLGIADPKALRRLLSEAPEVVRKTRDRRMVKA